MRILVAALLLIGLWAHRAAACPCCDPCHKYDHLREPPVPIEKLAAGYTAVGSPLGAHPKRKDVMRAITSARFLADTRGTRALRLIDGAHIPATIDHKGGDRIEIVRDLALDHGHFQLTLDGVVYTISPCTDDKHHAATCLAIAP